MKIDNSRVYEEKFNEGYSTAIKEIKENILIVIENNLYELTPRQLNKFRSIRLHTCAQGKWHKSLDYVQKNGNLLNNKIRVYNY